VSFSEAVYEGSHIVEGVKARLLEPYQIPDWEEANGIPVLIDPNADILQQHQFIAVADARLIKQTPASLPIPVSLHIGLGPGFTAGRDCHAVVETRRSHTLGRVYWTGTAQTDSGEPEGDPRRVLRAPADGVLNGLKQIGDHVEAGEKIAEVDSQYGVVSPFAGVLRGLIRPGLQVTKGLKIGDVDARDDASVCHLVSDKALAIGGGVLEALLSKVNVREQLFA
jgi:xanthine dehydrogenase accessory factor